MGNPDELIIIVDEENLEIGPASRQVMRRFNLPHRATYILVFNARGELLVHKRTASKDIYPGRYCPAVGGVVAAGESYEESAARELFEETGIKGVPLSTLFDFYHEEWNNKVWGRAFSCLWTGELILQDEEVESGSFLPVREAIALAERKPFTPDGLYVFRRWLKEKASSRDNVLSPGGK